MTVSPVAAAEAIAALETLLSGVQQQLAPVVNSAMQHASAALDATASAIAEPAAAAIMSARVNLPLDGTDGAIDWTPLYDALDHADTKLWAAQSPINGITEAAQAHVDASIAAILPNTTDLIGNALGAFGQLVTGLLGDLASTDDLWSSLYSQLRDAFSQDQDPLSGFISRVVKDLFSGVLAPLSVDPIPVPIRPPLAESPALGNVPTVEDLERQWEAYPPFVRSFIQAAILVANSYNVYSAMGSGWVAKYAQRSLIQEQPTPLSPPEIAQLLRRDLVESDWATEHVKRSGLSPELFDLFKGLTRQYLTATNYIDLWRRTQDDSILDNLHKLGLEDDDIERLKVLSLAIPTPSDLVRFMVRDVYDPDAVRVGMLDDEFEKKSQDAPYKQVGVDLDTLKQYWMAHWTLPSPSMYYAMFHRGLLSEQEMVDALKVSDFAPGWIDRLVKINYNVPGRIDVRRMYESGVITTHEELVTRHQHMGYSPEDAEILAQFVEALKQQQDEAAAQKLRGPLIQAVIKSYSDGAADYQTSLDRLVGLGVTADTAAYELQQGDLFRERERADKIKQSVGREYTRGFMSKDDTSSRLSDFGFEQNEIDGLFASWDLDRELSDLSAEAHHQRDLTRGEVIEAYTDHLIDAADAEAHLTALGYDGNEAATLLAMANYRTVRADQKRIEASLKVQFLHRQRNVAEVQDALLSYGYAQQRIEAILTEWTIEQDAARPSISSGTLERLIMQGVVPVDSLQSELNRRGYSAQDQNWLLTLWRTDMSVAADKLAEQQREFAIREARLNAGQQAQKQRFDEQQTQQAALQTQRLRQQAAAQAATQAFQVQRDAASAATRLQQQHDAQSAVAQRQATAIAAAAQRQSIANDQHQKALQAQADLAQRAQAAASQRQGRALQAQADRLQTQVNARAAAAAAAAQAHLSLQAAQAATQKQIIDLRSQIQSARDIQANAQRIASEQRAEAARVRQENRTQARAQIGAAQVAQQKAALDALQKQRDAAVADLNAKLATLEATAASQRQQQALAQQQAAQQVLRLNLPPGTFTDTAT